MLPSAQSALLLVDLQQDFFQGGALALPEAEKIFPKFNAWIGRFSQARLPIFASQSQFAPESAYFQKNGLPAHCLEGAAGTDFHPQLQRTGEFVVQVLTKRMGAQAKRDSVFQAVGEGGESFEALLRAQGITELFVGGMMTECVVKTTVLDALEKGFVVQLLKDSVVGRDAAAAESAIRAMEQAGAKLAAWTGPAPVLA